MKQIYIFLVCLFASISMNAQDKVMTVDNQTPGWLSSKMTYAQQVAVEDLTVTGYINSTDMEFINGLIDKRSLKVLNLYDVVTIDSYNDDYVLWDEFVNKGCLQKLTLPKVFKTNSNVRLLAKVDTLCWVCHSATKHIFTSNDGVCHIKFLEGTDTIPQEAMGGNLSLGGTFPRSLKVIEGNAIRFDAFGSPLVFPKEMVRMGSVGSTGYDSWKTRVYDVSSIVVSPSRFDFPDSLKVYYSQAGYQYSYRKDRSSDIFTSDTITVNEKCDSLYAQLKAKVAFFYAKNPPQHFSGDYRIEKIYVPEGCRDVYAKNAERMSDNIGSIIEMKKVSNIALRWTSPHQMVPNEHINLLFEIQPSDAFDKRLKWSSDNEEVATVDDNGEVYAHKSGTATITVTSYDGCVSNSCEIVVAKPVTGVSIEPAEVELTELGKTAQLTAKIQPEDATNKNVTWKSSNESVCMVSNKGELLTTGYGKTVVLVTTEDGNYVGTCIVIVSEETGIDNTTVSSVVKEVSRFSSQGQRLTVPTKGVNIVKYSDGSVRKEIVK